MELVAVERAPGAFQQPVSAGQILAVARRTLGESVPVVRAVELGLGTYHTTYRLELADGTAVVLRVAPDPARQWVPDPDALRNEYAAAPFLVGLGPLVPRVLGADFGHELLDRDYLVQSLLPGVPAPDRLDHYPRAQWDVFYRQLGTITRQIHAVRGTAFGPVGAPRHATWGEALLESFGVAIAELATSGLDSTDLRAVAELADERRPLFDTVEPRLLHGDLWHVNILLDPAAAEPTIVGICDSDRASWGDPLADWTIDRARLRPGTERDAFFDTYGPLPTDPATQQRLLFYRARHLAGGRVDIHRRRLDVAGIPPEHWDLGPSLEALRAAQPTRHPLTSH